MKFSKIIVFMIVLTVIAYTGINLWFFYNTGIEPTVLTGAFFAFMGGEVWALATIRKKEVEAGKEEKCYENGRFTNRES